MMLKRKLGFSLCLLLIYGSGMLLLSKTKPAEFSKISRDVVETISPGNKQEKGTQEAIGTLTIPKIHLVKPLFAMESPKNEVNQNVTILKGSTYPNQDNSQLFLAAHSGTSSISYFKDLNQLKRGDTFEVLFQNKTYTYQIEQIESQEKTGHIEVPLNQQKQAILTTCHPTKKNQQLIVIANIQKETGSEF